MSSESSPKGITGAIWPMAACTITGLALYVTRGVLDQTVTANGVIRFAMLPPWEALLGSVCLGALLLVGIDHLNAPRGTTTFKRPRLGELVLPLCSLIVLLLPFTPVIPDQWPALQALAGPMGAIVWLSVAALQVWVLWQSRLITARSIERWSLRSVSIAIFVATAAVAGLAAERLTNSALFPSGDEPHYLVIAQSLWRDHDLKIENNHVRGDYREYFTSDLDPHYLTRGRDGEIYSIHPIGMSILLAPVYALAGYKGAVWALILMGALAASIAWRWTVRTLNAPGAATFAWAAIALSAPFMFNTFTVYPEIAAGLAVMFALSTTLKTNTERSGLLPWLAVGIAIATLPWLSTKYAPMSAALLLVVIFRFRREKGPATFLRDSKVWTIVAIYAVSLAAWFAFFYAIWGNPLPMAPYGSLVQTTPKNLLFGGPGLLFDQEYGLLAYAPVYILAATGLYQMWRAGGDLRRQAIEITFIFTALLATVGAFGIWWGGSAAPARPIASGLLLLMLPIAMAFRSAPLGSPRRAAQHLLLWIGAGIAITLAIGQDGLLINNARDGSSALLDFWSPRWQLWSLAPTYIADRWLFATLNTAWWLIVAAGASTLLARTRSTRAGVSALYAFVVLAAALIVIAITMPLLPTSRPHTSIDLGARSRLAALDGFDARARPASIVYDPLRKGAATDALPQLVVGVAPMQRSDPQPVRVIHNGRFSLPAGTYLLTVKFNDRAPAGSSALALQVGRNGPPLHTWTIDAKPGESFQASLWLPLDQSFVGLRGSSELERGIASISFAPTSIVDAGDRPRVPLVLASAEYPAADLFFHDEQLYPEAQGFWTIGAHASHVTVAVPPNHPGPLMLRIHPGAKPNHVTISTFGWEQSYDLVPGQAAEVQLPPPTEGVIPLTIASSTGFSPKEFDPQSTDRRFLGIWVEVKEGTAKTP